MKNKLDAQLPEEVSEALMKMFKTEELVTRWLNTPQKHLNGSTPVSILTEPIGNERVLDLINRIKRGDFS